MRLLLQRLYKKSDYTIGKLSVDGRYVCDTLEPATGKGVKVEGKTAIPEGIYNVSMRVQSPTLRYNQIYSKCRGYVPRLMNVPGFSGILIHIGNTSKDTRGCILVGQNRLKGALIDSATMFWRLYDVLDEADKRNERITIEIA